MSQHSGEQQPGDRAAAEPRASWVELVAHLREELEELRAREGARDEGLIAPAPLATEDRARDDIVALTEQIDALRGTFADRLDGLQQQVSTLRVPDVAPLLERIGQLQTTAAAGGGATSAIDLRPVIDRLDRLHQQLSVLSAPDLHHLREQIDQLAPAVAAFSGTGGGPQQARLDRLAQQVASLPRADQIAAAIAPQLDAVRSALLPDAVLDAVDASTAALQERLRQAVDIAPAVQEALGPLSTRVDQLVTSEQVVRDDLALATEVLAGLTQVHEVTEQQLTELLEARSASEAEQRALGEAFAELSRSLTASVRQLETQHGALVARMAAFEDSVGGHLAGAIERIKDETRERVEDQLRGLGMPQLRTSITELVQQVVDGRAESREVLDAVTALAPSAEPDGEEVGSDHGAALGDLRADDLRHSLSSLIQHVVDGRAEARELLASVEAIDERLGSLEDRAATAPAPPPPSPELEQIASDLDRLRDEILSPQRPQPATAERLDAARDALADALDSLDSRLDAQAEEVRRVVAQVAEVELASREETASAIAQMTEELTATREALAQRAGSRRRWRGADEPVGQPLLPDRASDLEDRIEGIALSMDERLGALTAQVERAAEYSIEAAAAAKAALAGVTRNLLAPPPPPPPPPPPMPATPAATKKAAAKKPVVKKAAAKKAVVKEAVVKKAAAKKRVAKQTPAKREPALRSPRGPLSAPPPDPAPPAGARADSPPPRSS